MKMKSSPPHGAMYSLLLLVHMTLAVTANTTFTAGVTSEAPQTVTHTEALTEGHTDTTSAHIPAISRVPGTSAVHTEALTGGHTNTTSAHIPAISRILGTSAVHTETIKDSHTDRQMDRQTDRHTDRQTDRHTEVSSVHIAAGNEILETTVIRTVHHSTFISGHHPPGIHSTVTKKELQSIPQKTHTANITKSISVPNISVEIGNTFQVTCISERGPQVIHYELIQGDRIVKNMTVHGRKAATFQFNITPGSNEIYCRARTPSGEEETSTPLRIVGANPDSEDRYGDRPTKSDKEERDAAPEFLISLTHILTSVSQPVQDLNAIIISVCGPIILILLLLIFLTHFCNRRGRKVGSTFLSCCV